MESNTERIRNDFIAKQNFKGLSKVIPDLYFSKLENLANASENDREAFLKAIRVIENFNENPSKNWQNLVTLLEENPNIDNFYIEDSDGKKNDLVTIALTSGQSQAAMLFIDGEDSVARQEALEIAEAESRTDGPRALAEFKEVWKTPLYSRKEEQKYLLLAMYGATSNSFGICDKKNTPLDLPAFLIKTYSLNPHKKIKFSVGNNELIETPFSYALMYAEKQGRTFQVPKYETDFYRNADLSLKNIFGRTLVVQMISFSSDVSAKLLGAEIEKKSKKEAPTHPSQTTSAKFEQAEFDFFSSQTR